MTYRDGKIYHEVEKKENVLDKAVNGMSQLHTKPVNREKEDSKDSVIWNYQVNVGIRYEENQL